MGRSPATLLLLAAPLLACGQATLSAEDQVRRTLAALEQAAEAGDVADFKAGISERYQDDYGYDKAGLVAYATFHVLRNQRRHVLVRVRSVEILGEGRAEVALHLGLAGNRAGQGLAADAYKVDLDLEEEAPGIWRILWAQWHPAPAGDLL